MFGVAWLVPVTDVYRRKGRKSTAYSSFDADVDHMEGADQKSVEEVESSNLQISGTLMSFTIFWIIFDIPISVMTE